MRSGQLGWPTGTCPQHNDCVGPDRPIPGSERWRRAGRQIIAETTATDEQKEKAAPADRLPFEGGGFYQPAKQP